MKKLLVIMPVLLLSFSAIAETNQIKLACDFYNLNVLLTKTGAIVDISTDAAKLAERKQKCDETPESNTADTGVSIADALTKFVSKAHCKSLVSINQSGIVLNKESDKKYGKDTQVISYSGFANNNQPVELVQTKETSQPDEYILENTGTVCKIVSESIIYIRRAQ